MALDEDVRALSGKLKLQCPNLTRQESLEKIAHPSVFGIAEVNLAACPSWCCKNVRKFRLDILRAFSYADLVSTLEA